MNTMDFIKKMDFVRSFIKEHWQILLFNLLILICFVTFYGRFGDVIIDTFREAYIPEQIIRGKVLYKDIFSVYAPFGYLFNALLYLIFGVKLKVLYAAGLISALIISNLVFKISEMFMSKNCALSIVLFFISASVLSGNVFSLLVPYSFGLSYGLVFALASVWFALKQKYPCAYLMYSFAVCSKYEFILLLPLLIIASGKKDIIKNLAALILPIFAVFGWLFASGMKLDDLVISIQWLNSISSTKSLYWFYSVTGLVFRPKLISIYASNFAAIAVPFGIMHMIKHYALIPFILFYLYIFISQEVLVFAFPLILILFIIKFRTLDFNQKFVISASLLISAKVFFALTLQSYGVFFVPFALIPFFILAADKLRKTMMITVLLCAIVLGIHQAKILFEQKNVKIDTPRGVVYADVNKGSAINELLDYVKINTKPSDRVLVYPEGLIINYLADRPSDNKFYSLIPLYTETFGDDLIIKRLEITKPEYVVISNYDTSLYYYSLFGIDYAQKTAKYILKNYELKTTIGDNFRFAVFELKPSNLSP